MISKVFQCVENSFNKLRQHYLTLFCADVLQIKEEIL